jgi:hypothetical protein
MMARTAMNASEMPIPAMNDDFRLSIRPEGGGLGFVKGLYCAYESTSGNAKVEFTSMHIYIYYIILFQACVERDRKIVKATTEHAVVLI